MSDGKPSVQEEKEDPHKIATSMTLADISIRNHVFAWILMFALIGFGLLTFTGFGTVFRGLGISQNPDVDFPVVNVSITWEGASPEIMETDVVDILEETVTSVEGVKEVKNIVQVVPESRMKVVEKADAEIKDAVSKAIAADKTLDGISVKSVDKGVVLLAGKATPANALKALRAARGTAGVRQVSSEIALDQS